MIKEIQKLIRSYQPSPSLGEKRLNLQVRKEMYIQEAETHNREPTPAYLEIWDEQIEQLEQIDLRDFIRENLTLEDVKIEIVNADVPDAEEWFANYFTPALQGKRISDLIGTTLHGLLSRPLRALRFNLFGVERARDKAYFQIRIWLGEPKKCNSYLL